MSIQGVNSGAASTQSLTSHAVPTLAQSQAEANLERASGVVNDGDENIGNLIDKSA
jgi:hypothetical protein